MIFYAIYLHSKIFWITEVKIIYKDKQQLIAIYFQTPFKIVFFNITSEL